jgi:hypothetical protein
VQTSQPSGQQAPPQPELTKVAPLPGQSGLPGTTPTTPVKQEPTPEVKPTEEIKQEPAPTPEPTKIPEPPAPVGGTDPPVITTNPDANATVIPFGQTSGQPNSNPATGAGPSATPVWLALLSAIMVLGGWSLRRMSSAVPQPAKATATNQSE